MDLVNPTKSIIKKWKKNMEFEISHSIGCLCQTLDLSLYSHPQQYQTNSVFVSFIFFLEFRQSCSYIFLSPFYSDIFLDTNFTLSKFLWILWDENQLYLSCSLFPRPSLSFSNFLTLLLHCLLFSLTIHFHLHIVFICSPVHFRVLNSVYSHIVVHCFYFYFRLIHFFPLIPMTSNFSSS